MFDSHRKFTPLCLHSLVIKHKRTKDHDTRRWVVRNVVPAFALETTFCLVMLRYCLGVWWLCRSHRSHDEFWGRQSCTVHLHGVAHSAAGASALRHWWLTRKHQIKRLWGLVAKGDFANRPFNGPDTLHDTLCILFVILPSASTCVL